MLTIFLTLLNVYLEISQDLGAQHVGPLPKHSQPHLFIHYGTSMQHDDEMADSFLCDIALVMEVDSLLEIR